MNLQHIYNLCAQLQSITSTKAKQQFLVDNRCDEWDEFLKWLLNPQIVTGIDRKKLKKKVKQQFRQIIFDLNDMMDYLTEHNTGTDIDILMCQDFINGLAFYGSDEAGEDKVDDVCQLQEFVEKVITKSLKLGVDVKLVNKAYGKGFIPVHEVQLGSSRDKLRLKDGEVFFLTQKLNGVRCTYVNGKLISRQGTEFTGLDHIIDAIYKAEEKYGNQNMVLDGELIHKNDGTLSDNDNFRLGTGIINAKEGDKSNIMFMVFDILPYNDFVEGKSKADYSLRRTWLDTLSVILCKTTGYVEVVPLLYSGTDRDKIDGWLAFADGHGWEGIMLNKNMPYEAKRTTNLIKIKSFKFSDLRIIGYEEGDGKYKGMLGAVIVDYKGNSVNVGSGFDEAERVELWKNPDGLIGKIATIKYKEVSRNKDTGLESLQFPVWNGLREDKDEVSYE